MMIISEKQILELIMIARSYADYIRKQEKSPLSDVYAIPIEQYIDKIMRQQSEQLREVRE